jgi:hypothetical protein
MKRIIVLCGMLLVGGVLHAGTPLDQGAQTYAGPYSNTTLLGNSTGFFTLPAVSKSSGGTTYSGRNCLTRIIAQLSTSSTFYLLDGNTTSYVIYGQGLGSSGVNTLNVSEDHLGPLCGTAGNTMTLNLAPASTSGNVVDYEGFTYVAPFVNAGQ